MASKHLICDACGKEAYGAANERRELCDPCRLKLDDASGFGFYTPAVLGAAAKTTDRIGTVVSVDVNRGIATIRDGSGVELRYYTDGPLIAGDPVVLNERGRVQFDYGTLTLSPPPKGILGVEDRNVADALACMFVKRMPFLDAADSSRNAFAGDDDDECNCDCHDDDGSEDLADYGAQAVVSVMTAVRKSLRTPEMKSVSLHAAQIYQLAQAYCKVRGFSDMEIAIAATYTPEGE